MTSIFWGFVVPVFVAGIYWLVAYLAGRRG